MVRPRVPSQVAVLCGGLGTRLRPHTDLIPKPMVPVAGVPFLQHLLAQAASEGISRFLLMTGYLGSQISAYFGDGSRWGWDIAYSHGPSKWDTGRRLFEATTMLDETFVLLYSDNWADLDFASLIGSHRANGRAVTATLVRRNGGNVQYTAETDVENYIATPAGDSMDYVEIGYSVVEKISLMAHLANTPGTPDIGLPKILQSLAGTGDLGGHLISGHYRSISDPERLEVTRTHFSDRRILLLDRDGTINCKAAPGRYVSSREQFEFVPETVEAMQILATDGFDFIVITNQAGIALGQVDEDEISAIHAQMVDRLAAEGIRVLRVYMSPDHWDSESATRKPAPGMFHAASENHRFRLDRVLYVGDDIRDCHAAINAGCGMVFLSDEMTLGDLPANRRHCSVHRNLMEAVDMVRGYYGLEGER